MVERLLHTQEVAGSNPAPRIFFGVRAVAAATSRRFEPCIAHDLGLALMFYTYVLRCGDGNLYIGSTGNLRRRIVEHQAARATASRLPVTLEYYEACRSEGRARLREKQLKTGCGRGVAMRAGFEPCIAHIVNEGRLLQRRGLHVFRPAQRISQDVGQSAFARNRFHMRAGEKMNLTRLDFGRELRKILRRQPRDRIG